jgi:hypothetical protein
MEQVRLVWSILGSVLIFSARRFMLGNTTIFGAVYHMSNYRHLAAFVQDLHAFLAEHPGMKERVVDMVESYRMCRQLSHGDVHPDVTVGPDFQTMFEHVYGPEGGCAWCQRRIDNLERYKLSDSARLIEQIIQSIDPGGSPEDGEPDGRE